MESCLKQYDEAIVDLVAGNEKSHDRVGKRANETKKLKGRVLELETRNILLEAKVWGDSGLRRLQLRIFLIG